MKTILHSDYWAEVPAGECLLGLSGEQKVAIWHKIRDEAGYHDRSPHEQTVMDTVIEKLRRDEKPTREESTVFDPGTYIFADAPARVVELKRFYIARFPITGHQFDQFRRLGIPASELPGALEQPAMYEFEGHMHCGRMPKQIASYDNFAAFCEQLGARLPTADEWEKAARGPNGQLYPWGNEWNPDAGYFWYGQKKARPECTQPPVDAYPEGVSPYGVWGMVGGLPDLVTVTVESVFHSEVHEMYGQQVNVTQKGRHPREASEPRAYIHHLPALPGRGDWVALRPVLEEWTSRQWHGVDLGSGSDA